MTASLHIYCRCQGRIIIVYTQQLLSPSVLDTIGNWLVFPLRCRVSVWSFVHEHDFSYVWSGKKLEMSLLEIEDRNYCDCDEPPFLGRMVVVVWWRWHFVFSCHSTTSSCMLVHSILVSRCGLGVSVVTSDVPVLVNQKHQLHDITEGWPWWDVPADMGGHDGKDQRHSSSNPISSGRAFTEHQCEHSFRSVGQAHR